MNSVDASACPWTLPSSVHSQKPTAERHSTPELSVLAKPLGFRSLGTAICKTIESIEA
ncbi:MAG: hypothetical protein KME32_26505 [Mojavia pulchra JT2-VF2]|uniref:Uncharacterized protein n=1 Tax=Mojavia pulchra JT2-VF2 TaxID=287848 RepID=A0A951Q2I5_9NOST|nr:hypothetical protein [Mojavia pulchra JT2-VF2]